MFKKNFLLSLIISLFSIPAMAKVVYVDSANFGNPANGSSWSLAYTKLEIGINAAISGDTIFVAKGTYYPPLGSSAYSFIMKEGVKMYGGFSNTNTAFSQRDWATNITTLHGVNMGGPVIYNITNNLTLASIIDGFTIKSGFAGGSGGGINNNNSSPTISNCIFVSNTVFGAGGVGGGAIFNGASSPMIKNCSFINNSVNKCTGGGAIYNTYGSPTIINCNFSGNVASGTGSVNYKNSGGAIYNYHSSAIITDCTFSNNSSIGNGSGTGNNDGNGGAIFNDFSTPSITNCSFLNNNASGSLYSEGRGGAITNFVSNADIKNCLFYLNTSSREGGAIFNTSCEPVFTNCNINSNTSVNDYGGGIYNYSSPSKITNCTIAGNSAVLGSGIYNIYSGAKVTNSVIWGNNSGIYDYSSASEIRYSLVQGLTSDTTFHNIDGTNNPLFADATAGNYQLQSSSPCINAGRNDSIPSGIITDLAGNARITNGIVDMGAYEFGSTPLPIWFITLTGHQQSNNANLLNWHAINENAISFELQRGMDGKVFTTFYQVNASVSNDHQYNYIDEQPDGNSYYRVLIHESNGNIQYSNVAFIASENPIPFSCSAHPNPAKDVVTILNNNPKLINTIATLSDAYGHIVKSVTMQNKSQQLSLSGLASGVYILKMQNGQALKIVKE